MLCTKGVVDLQTGGNKMLNKTTTKIEAAHVQGEPMDYEKHTGDDSLCCGLSDMVE